LSRRIRPIAILKKLSNRNSQNINVGKRTTLKKARFPIKKIALLLKYEE